MNFQSNILIENLADNCQVLQCRTCNDYVSLGLPSPLITLNTPRPEIEYGFPEKTITRDSKASISLYKKNGYSYVIKNIPTFEFVQESSSVELSMKLGIEMSLNLSALREVSILKLLRHPHIVELLDVFSGLPSDLFSSLSLVMPYVGPSLKNSKLSHLDGERILFELLTAIKYIHSMDIVHRDIKPENILLDSSMHVKLIDFGLSKPMHIQRLAGHSVSANTWTFRPPEVHLGWSQYGKSVDIWAFGSVCYYVLTGQMAFSPKKEIVQRSGDYLKLVFGWLGCPFGSTLRFYLSLPKGKIVAKIIRENSIVPNKFLRRVCSSLELNGWAGVLYSCWEYHPNERADATTLLLDSVFRHHVHNASDAVLRPSTEIPKVVLHLSPFQKLGFYNRKGVLFSWYLDLLDNLSLPISVFFKAVELHNRWMASRTVLKNKYQLFGAACFIISTIYLFNSYVSFNSLVRRSKNVFTVRELRHAVLRVLDDLKYELVTVNSHDVLYSNTELRNNELVADVLLCLQFIPLFEVSTPEDELAVAVRVTTQISTGKALVSERTMKLFSELSKNVATLPLMRYLRYVIPKNSNREILLIFFQSCAGRN